VRCANPQNILIGQRRIAGTSGIFSLVGENQRKYSYWFTHLSANARIKSFAGARTY